MVKRITSPVLGWCGPLIAIVLWLCSGSAFGQLPTPAVSMDALVGEEIAIGAVFVNPPVFNVAGLPFTPYYTEVTSFVALDVNEFVNTVRASSGPQPRVWEVTFDVTGTPLGGGPVQTIANQTLRVEYTNEEGQMYDYTDVLPLGNSFQEININVTGISVDGVSVSAVADVDAIRLYAEVRAIAYGNPVSWPQPSSGFFAVTTGSTNPYRTDASGNYGFVEVTWPIIAGAVEYDFEWLFVDNYGESTQIGLPETETAANIAVPSFRHNSTRITTGENHFRIPVIYESGYLVWRLRPVGRSADNTAQRVEHNWTSCTNCESVQDYLNAGAAFLIEDGHQVRFAYSASVSYAEEAKYKVVASYFDGALRSRQTVTQNNSENAAIVGETIYDYLGRPVVSTLPAPVMQGNATVPEIRFYGNFNQVANNVPFDYPALQGPGTGTACNPIAVGLWNGSGAERYYSANNPLTSLGAQRDYLPQAEGFPYTQTVYRRDNTGRVAEQSGVGFAHRIGDPVTVDNPDGTHQTRFFYARPFQEELNRLFGVDVGYNEHYMKNVTIDANNQVSVSYVDMHGRTVATALAGETPENLEALPSNNGPTLLRVDLSDTQTEPVLTPGNERLESHTNFSVISPGDYIFNYGLDMDQAVYNYCNRCATCVYNLTVRVTDDCGEVVLDIAQNPAERLIHIGPEGVAQAMAVCDPNNPPDPITISLPYADLFTLPLSIGQYTVTRILSLDQGLIDDQVDELMAQPCSTLADFQALFPPDYSGCVDPCVVGCETVLGTFDNYIIPLREQYLTFRGIPVTSQYTIPQDVLDRWEHQYETELAECQRLCDPTISTCEVGYELMLSDMSPGGQYFPLFQNYPPSNPNALPVEFNTFDPHTPFTLSRTNGFMGQFGLSATNPLTNLTFFSDCHFRDEAGNLVTPDGSTELGDMGTEFVIQFLIDNWEPSFANELVKLHPEYCLYEECIRRDQVHNPSTRSSTDFEYAMTQVDDYTPALIQGYANPLGLNPAITPGMPNLYATNPPVTPHTAPVDPFFQNIVANCGTFNSINTPLAWMTDRMLNFTTLQGIPNDPNPSQGITLNLWQAAVYTTTCYNAPNYNALQNCLTNSQFGTSSDPSRRLLQYRQFAALYAMLKAELVEEMCVEAFDPSCSVSLDAGFTPRYGPGGAILGTLLPNGSPDISAESPEDVEDLAEAGQGVTSNSLQDCGERCNVLADGWMAQMKDCLDALTYTSATERDALEQNLRAGFRQICEATCTPTTPYGASQLPGSATITLALPNPPFQVTVSNFAQIIDAYLAPYGASSESWDCSPLRFPLSSPSASTDYEPGDGLTIASDCSCDIICDLYEGYQASPTGLQVQYPTFSHYFNFKNGTNYPLPYINYILCWCRAQNGDPLPEGSEYANLAPFTPPLVPEILACDPCISCEEIKPAVLAFHALPWVVDYANAIAPLNLHQDPDYPILLTAYLNNTFGVQYGYYDYQKFLQSCYVDFPYGMNILNYIGDPSRPKPIAPLCGPYPPYEDPCITNPDSCCQATAQNQAAGLAMYAYTQWLIEERARLRAGIVARCLEYANSTKEQYDMLAPFHEYHYTLYYYDQAGNLILTVAPEDVSPIDINQTVFNYFSGTQTTFNQLINDHRDSPGHPIYLYENAPRTAVNATLPGGEQITAHAKFTEHHYNSLNAVVATQSPDGGLTRFFHDNLGRLVLSQDARQRVPEDFNGTPHLRYSFTLYDALNRPVIAGESLKNNSVQNLPPYLTSYTGGEAPSSHPFFLLGNNTPSHFIQADFAPFFPLVELLPNGGNFNGSIRQFTQTWYDETPTSVQDPTIAQRNLRKRVAATAHHYNAITALSLPEFNSSASPLAPEAYQHIARYDYDIHGNAANIYHQYPFIPNAALARKHINYEYDLLSGNVLQVTFQPGQIDEYAHRYTYDADNRLRTALTSRDGWLTYETDATYRYYLHGPLARTEIGQLLVQGLDYTHTLHGWTKALNSPDLLPANDPGRDGFTSPTNPNALVCRDVAAFSLHYYNDGPFADYRPISAAVAGPIAPGTPLPGNPAPSLYNGNIAAMQTGLDAFMATTTTPWFTNHYTYDQLNRITTSRLRQGPERHRSTYQYDANGNLTRLRRLAPPAGGGAPVEMDDMRYRYYPGTNRLQRVNDAVTNTALFTGDFEDQAGNNYQYDAIGNLIRDTQANTTVFWNLQGKVDSVVTDGPVLDTVVRFRYDEMGHRIAKTVYQVRTSDGALTDLGTTLYIRDLQGNVLAVYRTDTWPTQEAGTRGGNRRNRWFQAVISHSGNALQVFEDLVRPALYRTQGTGQPSLGHLNQLRNQFLNQNWAQFDNKMALFNIAINPCTLNQLFSAYYLTNFEELAPLLFESVTHQYGQYKWRQAEAHIYGSSRLGLEHTNVESKDTLEYRFRLPLTCANNDWTAWLLYEDAEDVPQNLYVRGDKRYELTNHLGNVLATITDRRRHGQSLAVGTPVVAWFAETANAQMYWPFGSVVTEYQFTASWAGDYRYGFNGKEFDPEWGNQYDYGFRIYNPQVGRFLSVDPLSPKYPWYTPYQFAGNKPIQYVDIDGLEEGAENRHLSFQVALNQGRIPLSTYNRLTGAPTLTPRQYQFLKGVGNVIGGGTSVAAGVPMTLIPAGVTQAAGGLLIAGGITQFGLGAGQIADAIANETPHNIPSGPAEALGMGIDAAAGTDGTFQNIGAAADFAAPLAIGIAGIRGAPDVATGVGGVTPEGNTINPDGTVTITQPYQRRINNTSAMRESVQGQPCEDCGAIAPRMVANHRLSLVEEYYTTGTNNVQHQRSVDAVGPHCPTCSQSQGGTLSHYSRQMRSQLPFTVGTPQRNSSTGIGTIPTPPPTNLIVR